MIKATLLHCDGLPAEVRHRAEQALRAILLAELRDRLRSSFLAFQLGGTNGWQSLNPTQTASASDYIEVFDRTSAKLLRQLNAPPDAYFQVKWLD